VRLRLPLDFCRSLKACQTGCLLGTSGADSLKARAILSSKHSTDLGQVHTPPIPEKKISSKIPSPSWNLGFLALVRMHRIPGLFWSSYRPFSFLSASPFERIQLSFSGSMLSHISHAQKDHRNGSVSEYAGQYIDNRGSNTGGAIRGSPTSSIHNFSLENSGLGP
jgi:hypothetical protein